MATKPKTATKKTTAKPRSTAAKANAVAAADPQAGDSYIEWGAIFAGVALAAAISVILYQFGAAVGFATPASARDDGGVSWIVMVAGLWVVLVTVASSTAGGYVAGRMRSRRGDAKPEEVEFRDGTHGLIVWSVSTLLVVVVTGLVGALSAASAGVAAAVAPASLSQEMLAISGNVSIIFGFATAAGSALGAAAAWFASELGGEHRDQGISVNEVVPEFLRR